MTKKNGRWKQHFDETVNYEQTVKALIAFTALVVHDGRNRRPNSEFGFGRRMSPANYPDQTPDLVAQKSASYGVVVEAKKSLTRDETRWKRHVEQAAKYRQPLDGWFTTDGRIGAHDVVILVHQSRSRTFARFVDKQVRDGLMIEPDVALVEFNQTEETASYYFFRLERGSISDGELSASLESGTQVPLSAVLKSFPNVRYYDAPAPYPLLLTHLWTDFFADLAAGVDYDEKTRARPIRVSVAKITDELQKAFGSAALRRDGRSVQFPRQSLVREAFERLVTFNLARRIDGGGNDEYEVLFRAFRNDIREKFCQMEARLKSATADQAENQPSLLDNLGPETPEGEKET
jgi:hypothetical protein